MADALIEAVWEKNDVPLVKQLIGKGVDVDVVDEEGRNALSWAVNRGFGECAQLLLEANADVNKADNAGWTPLHFASNFGHAECVKILVDWKANVNAKTNSGNYPLHWAAEQGHSAACVEMLVQAGTVVDARNNRDNTPLALAIRYNKHDIAELLLDKGAKMSNFHENFEIPFWMNAIVAKRQK